MKVLKSFFYFLLLNFSALGLGGLLMKNGPSTQWYLALNKAPWTPPGWVFGAAWTVIMICFALYMAYLYEKQNTRKLIVLFSIQFVLNVSWNYVFFNQHMVLGGLIVITLLTVLVLYFLFFYRNVLKIKSFLILPYVIWLCIATSLNLYILLNN